MKHEHDNSNLVRGFKGMLKNHRKMLAAIRSLQSTPEKARGRILLAYKSGTDIQWLATFLGGWVDEEPGRQDLPFGTRLYRVKPSKRKRLKP